MRVTLKFLGGARSVTGSKYLLDIDGYRLLVDCGLFQGLKELRLRNWSDLPEDPSNIDAVVLTHAHIDHSGYLPRLVRNGFTGPVYCTASTADLIELMLMDSAHLQEEEAAYARKKGYSRHKDPKPLYDRKDVERLLPLVKPWPFERPLAINEKIQVRFSRAGHILGAASVEVTLRGEQQEKTVVFSGDIGRREDPVLDPPSTFSEADILLIESTYGDREVEAEPPQEVIGKILNHSYNRQGVVMIPAFSVGRTQNILYYIDQLMDNGAVPEMPIYMDSPMAIRATELYRKHFEDHKLSEKEVSDPESFLNMKSRLHIRRGHEESMALNSLEGPAIIISASGMMTGGRILHHLLNRLGNEQDTLLIVGYQAIGTRGRRILDEEPYIKIFGEYVSVKCRVHYVQGLSAHADRDELLSWAAALDHPPKKCFVVHGEESAAESFAASLRHRFDWANVVVPDYLETVELFDGI